MPRDEAVLMTPVIARGTTLPARFDSSDWQFHIYVPPDVVLELEVAIDDSADPHIMRGEVTTPLSQARLLRCGVLVRADKDGTLDVSLTASARALLPHHPIGNGPDSAPRSPLQRFERQSAHTATGSRLSRSRRPR